MRPEDLRYHEALLSQITPERTPFSSKAATGRIIERQRRDLSQILAFNRITDEEYEELDARYAELAKEYPVS